MITSLAVRPGRLLLAAGCSTMLCLAAGCATASRSAPPTSSAAVAALAAGTSQGSSAEAAPGRLPVVIGGDPARVAAELTSAEAALGTDSASPTVMARQALTVQLAALASPTTKLPPWKIVPAEQLASLRADYLAAQAATGVGWQYLAAINFVETDFGRIAGLSSAGAQGPMQFIPSTWAAYGRGDVRDARDAIFAAARFLAASGAPGDIGSAVHAYNPSWRYVDAVLRYAGRLHADPAALPGYYDRQVAYRLGRGWVLLPPGFGSSPAVRPVPLRS